MFKPKSQSPKTSWEKESSSYADLTKGSGHYYHEHIVIPGVVRLLSLKDGSKLLDLGCGSGVLGRQLKPNRSYLGIDVSPGLIEEAKKLDHQPDHDYIIRDSTKPLSIARDFTHAALVLSLQNMRDQSMVIKNVSEHLVPGGILVIVLNHPCFRIPRQSSWGIDEVNKIQYRKINRYLTPIEIPITMHPGRRNSPITWSYHEPVSFYSQTLKDFGFVIETIEEWASDKNSVGDAAKMENRARSEFPLFLTIKAVKK